MQVNETTNNNIDRLLDVEMNVTVRFGTTEVPLREVVRYGVGSMIELNRSVDEPVEVVVVDGYYGEKVTEIGSRQDRSESLLNNSASGEANEVQP